MNEKESNQVLCGLCGRVCEIEVEEHRIRDAITQRVLWIDEHHRKLCPEHGEVGGYWR